MRRAFWALTVCFAAPIPKEVLIHIPALAILTIATVLMGTPARAQTYNPAYPVCLQTYGRDGNYIECGIPRWRSALSRRRAAPPSASSIRILRAGKCPRDHVLGGIAASIKCLAGRLSRLTIL
jgi:hypothetical protein